MLKGVVECWSLGVAALVWCATPFLSCSTLGFASSRRNRLALGRFTGVPDLGGLMRHTATRCAVVFDGRRRETVEFDSPIFVERGAISVPPLQFRHQPRRPGNQVPVLRFQF